MSVPIVQMSPLRATTVGAVNVAPVPAAVTVAMETATVACEGSPAVHACRDGKYRLAIAKWLPAPSDAMAGSPDHCWSTLLFGSPTRSTKCAPPSEDSPTPV